MTTKSEDGDRKQLGIFREPPMTLDEYQAEALKTAIYSGHDKLNYGIVGLGGEAGEILNKWQKVLRDNNGNPTPEHVESLRGELGGVLWYVAYTAKQLGVKLSTVGENNLQILADRSSRGVIKGSGDNR